MTQNTLHFNVSLTPQWTIMILVNWLNFKRNEIYEKGTGNIGSGRHRLHRQSSETGTDSVFIIIYDTAKPKYTSIIFIFYLASYLAAKRHVTTYFPLYVNVCVCFLVGRIFMRETDT